MKILSIEELQSVIDRHPGLRLHMIPMDRGLLVDNHILLVPTAEGELQGADLRGLEDIHFYGGSN